MNLPFGNLPVGARSPGPRLSAALISILLLSSSRASAAEDALDEESAQPKKPAAEAEDKSEDDGGDANLVRAFDLAPKSGTPLIASKRFPMKFRFEFTGSVDLSYAERFVRHRGGHAAFTFHPLDFLGVEVFGGHLSAICGLLKVGGCELAITKAVRLEGRSFREFQEQPKLSDLWQTTWVVGTNLQWAPFYGKLSVVSEYDINFQLYLLGGFGLDGIQKIERQTGGTEVQDVVTPPPGLPFRPSANFGVGLRLIPWKYIALRLELRNYLHLNPAVDEVDFPETDLGFTPLINLGVSFLL